MRKLTNIGCLILFVFLCISATNSEELGIASYYSDSFHGRKTASGETYDKTKLTGAHKSLPFGTIVEITRLDTRESVKIRINDRGPYIKGRIVELSKKAAERVNLLKDGNARVRLEVIGKGQIEEGTSSVAATPPPPAPIIKKETPKPVEKEKPASYNTKKNDLPKSDIAAATERAAKEEAKRLAEKKAAEKRAADKAAADKLAAEKAAADKKAAEEKATAIAAADKEINAPLLTRKGYQPYDLYKVQVMRPKRQGFGVQVASLSSYEGVMMKVAELQEKWFKNVLISVEKGTDGKTIYKCILGPFEDRATATSYQKRLKKNKKIQGFVVDLGTIEY